MLNWLNVDRATLIVLIIELAVLIYQTGRNRKKECCDLTIKLLLDWSLNLNSNMTRSRKIVESFNKEQCEKLFNNEVFDVQPDQYIEIYKRCYNKAWDSYNDCMQVLTPSEINTLRDDVIKYLNLLESVLAARQYGVADDKLITKEFKYLVQPQSGQSVLNVFIEAMNDIESYPAIKKFCEDMNKKSKQSD